MRYQVLILGVLLGIAGMAFAQNPANVVCGDGLAGGDCRVAAGFVRMAIGQLSASVPGWRWIVVPADNWPNVARAFGVEPTVPAFSHLVMRSTYLNSALVLPSLRVDEYLQRYSNRSGRDRLRWVVAHEMGHIVCQTHDERLAQDAAGRIEFGRKLSCPVVAQKNARADGD